MIADHADREQRLSAVLVAYLEAIDEGHEPDCEELLARYPEFAGELMQFLEDQRRVERRAAPLREVVRHRTSAEAGGVELAGRTDLGDFRILREIGRGGMGVVYEAEQMSLGRRVALKVLPLAATMDSRHLQRFHNEARAAAGLHHGHIVPVFYVGCERGVHFYAMQLIEGQTLAAVIRELQKGDEAVQGSRIRQNAGKPDPVQGSRIRQNAGKPDPHSGECGYEQGELPTVPHVDHPAPTAETLAKASLSTEGSRRGKAYYRKVAELGIQAAEALDYAHERGVIHRDIKPANLMLDGHGALWVTDFGLAHLQHAEGSLTMTGDLVGTLRYMSPEQALGQRAVVDHRTDVYSLGAMLYELLTLRPAFTGQDRQELLRQVAFEEPKAPRKLERRIPAELETIVLKAMEKNAVDRYGTAKEVAEDLERWLEERPIQARRPSLPQRLRKWVRRNQALVSALAVCLLVSLLALTGSAGWILGDRAGRLRAAEIKIIEAMRAAEPGLRRGNPYDAELIASAEKAKAQLDSGAVGQRLSAIVEQLRRDVNVLRQLETARLWSASSRGAKVFDEDGADKLYGRAFKEYGLDLTASDYSHARERIRQSPIRSHLVVALDLWAPIKNRLHSGEGASLIALADLVDDDSWRRQLRAAVRQEDTLSIENLGKSEDILSQSPGHIVLLATALRKAGRRAAAEPLLRRAQQQHPADFWILFELAGNLNIKEQVDYSEVVQFYRAALALRPQSAVVYNNLGSALFAERKYLGEAEAACRKAIQLMPNLVDAYSNLSLVLCAQNKAAEAEAAILKAISFSSNDAELYCNLYNALDMQKKHVEAEAACHSAIRLQPKMVEAYVNLGKILLKQGKPAEAEIALRKGLLLKPAEAWGWQLLGVALRQQGKMDTAIAAYRRAIELAPDHPVAYNNLSVAFCLQGKFPAAEATFRELIRIRPGSAAAHFNLGIALSKQSKQQQAEEAYRTAIALQPDHAEAHCYLGLTLRDLGRFADALALLKRGHELGSRSHAWPHPSAEWVRTAQRQVELDTKLSSVLQGKAHPADAIETIALAELCLLYKKQYSASVRLYTAAFAAQPKLAEEQVGAGSRRYNAACAAALAACGRGSDAEQTNDAMRAAFCRQSLDWLRRELTARQTLLQKEPGQVVRQLRYWQKDTDFTGVRGPDALGKLPEKERAGWQQFWTDVASTLAAAEKAAVAKKKPAPN